MKNQTFIAEATLGKGWQQLFKKEFEKPYMIELKQFIDKEKEKGHLVLPRDELIFNAFIKTQLENVKVIIVGQDPYHQKMQAHGLSFSVPEGVKIPPSLRNIFKELKNDLGIAPFSSGCLDKWAEQGVLLLNTTLTVNEGKPLSHKGQGWEIFTDFVIETLAKRDNPLIFVLWGASAMKKMNLIAPHKQHSILTSSHPSPLSAHAGFLGCGHFSKINNILKSLKEKEINWRF